MPNTINALNPHRNTIKPTKTNRNANPQSRTYTHTKQPATNAKQTNNHNPQNHHQINISKPTEATLPNTNQIKTTPTNINTKQSATYQAQHKPSKQQIPPRTNQHKPKQHPEPANNHQQSNQHIHITTSTNHQTIPINATTNQTTNTNKSQTPHLKPNPQEPHHNPNSPKRQINNKNKLTPKTSYHKQPQLPNHTTKESKQSARNTKNKQQYQHQPKQSSTTHNTQLTNYQTNNPKPK